MCCFQQSFCCKPGGLPQAQAAGHLDSLTSVFWDWWKLSLLLQENNYEVLAQERTAQFPVVLTGCSLPAQAAGWGQAAALSGWLPEQTAARGWCLNHTPPSARIDRWSEGVLLLSGSQGWVDGGENCVTTRNSKNFKNPEGTADTSAQSIQVYFRNEEYLWSRFSHLQRMKPHGGCWGLNVH